MAHDLSATDVLRGTCRWLLRAGVNPLAEVPLSGGRRADILGVDAAGRLTLVEIKISLADLRGDRKWPDYLDHCDRFFWAVDADFPTDMLPAETGLILADAYDAEIIRMGPQTPLAGARRKAMLQRFARQAALRLQNHRDPGVAALIG